PRGGVRGGREAPRRAPGLGRAARQGGDPEARPRASRARHPRHRAALRAPARGRPGDGPPLEGARGAGRRRDRVARPLPPLRAREEGRLMRFARVVVEHFRAIERADVTFEPGLNVLHGPNDLGKSTLAAALRAALLLPHGSSEAEEYVPW